MFSTRFWEFGRILEGEGDDLTKWLQKVLGMFPAIQQRVGRRGRQFDEMLVES